jgi:hypothetical protein
VANTILTIDMITREALRILENNLVLTRNINRQYDSSFVNEGAKIGSTLRIRKPDRVLVSDGAALQVQDETQQWTTLTVSSQKHVGFSFTSAEMTMSLQDYSDNVLAPRISQLASSIDADVANCFKQIGQSVGIPGTTPASAQVLLAANQKLNESASPMGERYATVNPAANAGLVNGLTGLFNPVSTVSKQFKSGLMSEGILGLDEMAMSQSIATFTPGTRTSGTMAAVATQGAVTLSLTGLGATLTVKAGDVFSVAGSNAVNPQTRQSTGSLFQFVVLADTVTSGGGTATVSIYPVYDATNALATVDVLPANGAVVTFMGSSAGNYPQNLVYHKNAIAFATADLIIPKGVDMAARVQHNGISLRAVRAYDVVQDRMVGRIDVLYGYGVIRPELGVRLWG